LFDLVDVMQKSRGLGITGAQLDRLLEVGSCQCRIAFVQEMIGPHK
jgi:hypothetical protein